MANNLRLASFTLSGFFFRFIFNICSFRHFECRLVRRFCSIRLNSIRFNFIRQNSDSLFSRFLLLNRLISSVWRNFSIIFGSMAYHAHWNCYITVTVVQYHVFASKIKIQKEQENGEQRLCKIIEVALLWFSSIWNEDFKVSVKHWNDISISFIDTS